MDRSGSSQRVVWTRSVWRPDGKFCRGFCKRDNQLGPWLVPIHMAKVMKLSSVMTSFIRKALLSILLFFLLPPHIHLNATDEGEALYHREVEARAANRYQAYEALFRQFIQIVESNLELRRDAKLLFRNLHRNLSTDDHLTSEEQQALKRKLTLYRENYEALAQFVSPLQSYSISNVTIQFPVSGPTGRPSETQIVINPSDDLGRLMILEIKMWLAAKLIVLDNYVVVLARYLKKDGLRRQFNLATIDPEAKAFLEEVTEQLRDGKKYGRILRAIELVQRVIKYEKDNPATALARDKDNSYLNTLIEGSYAYRRIPELTLLDQMAIKAAVSRNAFIDDVVSLTNKATYEISELFGNAIGLYEERKGKLHDLSQEKQKKLSDELQPLDILFEKTPFRLTDRFIPGHWGHVAIWVGDKDDIPELKHLGVWQELPRIEAEVRSKWGYSGPSFQSLIENNHGIIEALRPGVELNTFAHFLNIDDLAVIRDSNLTAEKKKHYLLRAFTQIGKEYDFNFDVETHKRIVCSELAFVVYDDYDWPVQESVGRYTVSPDHVAALALGKSDPFSPVLIIHDGKKLPKRHNRENFNRLLKGEYDQIRFH